MQVPWFQTQSKAYKLWDLELKSVVIYRDVHFVESKLDNCRILTEFMIEILAPLEFLIPYDDVSPSSPPTPPTATITVTPSPTKLQLFPLPLHLQAPQLLQLPL